jgi:hypothetical protein
MFLFVIIAPSLRILYCTLSGLSIPPATFARREKLTFRPAVCYTKPQLKKAEKEPGVCMKKAVRRAALCLITAVLLGVCPPPGAAAQAAPDGAVPIRNRADLESIAENPQGSYVLMDHIDMGDAPWTPIPFEGILDGGGYSLYNLTIRQPDPQTAISVDGNHKEYETVFAALFSRAYNADIRSLTLLGADVDIDTPLNCYAAGLVGYAENTLITDCRVFGRVALAMAGRMCGVAGLVGFGYGTASNCEADVTLTLVDNNRAEKCEQFLGGILASGYMDIERCRATVRGYASVYGYVHNGGVVGMYYVHTDERGHAGYVTGNTVNAVVRFFEANDNRRAYCSPIIGEQMHWILELGGNTVEYFENGETRDTATTLLPESCAVPVYAEALTPPACTSFGYTTFTCTGCGYSYTGLYAAPRHQPGQWEVARRAAPDQDGLRVRYCTLCGVQTDEETLISAQTCALSQSSVEMEPGQTVRLTAVVQPENATDGEVLFTSSNQAVATVAADGAVTATGPGSAEITCATRDANASAVCVVLVKTPFPATPVMLLGAGAVLALGLILILAGPARRRKKRRTRHSGPRR